MPGLARIGDQCTGYCKSHSKTVSGSIVQGSSNVLNGPGVARVGDTCVFDCGHTGTVSSGSQSVLTNGRQTAHIGSSITGTVTGNVIAGSNNVQVG